MNRSGFAPPTRFLRPRDAISTRNYPRPAYGNTYITNNTTIINNNYLYDSGRYQPHVSNFYGQQSPLWGNHWRYGCSQSPAFGLSIGIEAHFGYGSYVYTPYYTPCVASPYYYDPYVPAYVPESRVVVWSGYNTAWDEGDQYDYQQSNAYDSYGDPQLNYGISALTLAYQNRNVGLVADVSGSGQVAIFAENRYQYSVDSGDFRQMMVDNCRATRTVSFEVLRVRHHGDRGTVSCRHRFRAQDGSIQVVYMTYQMRRVRDRYAITDYMTSSSPI